MSENPSRRAPLVTILALFVLFALFAVVVYYVYLPRQTGVLTGNQVTPDSQRIETLAKLRSHEAEMATRYSWIDQQAGQVQLPLERAKELTLQQYAKKQ